MTGPGSPQAAECPRCGHHIDGELLRLASEGAAEVTCSECGLGSRIEEIRADAAVPKWLSERHGGFFARFGRAFRTMLAALRPHRFWSSIPMQLPISWKGMLALFLALAVVLHIAAATRRLTELRSSGSEFAVDAAWAVAAPVSTFNGSALLQGATAPDFPQWATVDSLGRLVSMLPSAWAIGLFEAFSRRGTSLAGGNSIIGGSVPPAWFVPGSGRQGLIMGQQHVAPYRNPAWAAAGNTIAVHSLLQPFSTRPLERIGLASIVAFGPTIALLLLPMSLRRVKARPRHIVRGLLYAALPATAVLIVFFLRIPNDYRVPYVTESDAWTQSIVAGSAIMFVWTHAYCARYIRLPHAAGVALSGTVLATLVALMAMNFIDWFR